MKVDSMSKNNDMDIPQRKEASYYWTFILKRYRC